MVENGIAFITLCDSSYPRKLAFHYLQDLQKEFENFDSSLIKKVTRPYCFIKFGNFLQLIVRFDIDLALIIRFSTRCQIRRQIITN